MGSSICARRPAAFRPSPQTGTVVLHNPAIGTLPPVGALDRLRGANGDGMIERARSNPRLLVAIAAGAILLLAWIGWAIYVTSSNGATAGLGVVIAWPAMLAALALISLPFIGGYLLIRQLSEDSGSTATAEADVDEEEDEDEEEPEESAEEEGEEDEGEEDEGEAEEDQGEGEEDEGEAEEDQGEDEEDEGEDEEDQGEDEEDDQGDEDPDEEESDSEPEG